MGVNGTALEIVKYLGGATNIDSATHCVTRLRLSLKDDSIVDDDAIKSLPEVKGVVRQGGQYQIIIGPSVDKVYEELQAELSLKQENKVSNIEDKKASGKKNNVFSRIIDVLISCFAPIIPVIAGSGMIKVLVTVLIQTGLVSAESPTMKVLTLLGDAVFYFLPFFVAYTAAKKFGTDHFLAMIMAGVLLHPNLMELATKGASSTTFLHIPLQIINYSAQAIPVIAAVWLMKYVDKFADRISPNVFKVFLRPMITILIVAPVLLIVFGPLGALVGEYFAAFVDIMNKWGWIAVSLNALIFPFLVLSGTHNALIPLIVTMFATKGYDPVLIVSGLLVNIAQAGAAFAVATKTKDSQMRGTGISTGISALFGITEPALYGVNLRLKRPFIAVLIGSALSGVFAGIMKVTAHSFVSPSIISLPIFIGKEGLITLVWAILSILLSFTLSFIMVWILGFKDINPDLKQKKIKKEKKQVEKTKAV